MTAENGCADLADKYIVAGKHDESDYFGLVRELLKLDSRECPQKDKEISDVYCLVEDEIRSNVGRPGADVNFGTSGWRGILGKDIFVKSVTSVTAAIIKLYEDLEVRPEIKRFLGVSSLEEAKERGCLVGYDNRFGGEILGREVAHYLSTHGFKVYFCGETTTGVMSAALLMLDAAFSINLTPSHNPLEYGGYKYNAADAGPAASELTKLITEFSRAIILSGVVPEAGKDTLKGEIQEIDSFALWQKFVVNNQEKHGIDYDALIKQTAESDDVTIVIDSMHGASRLHVEKLLGDADDNLTVLRKDKNVSFGGIAPEPSSENMRGVTETLAGSDKRLRIGAIIDPDGDRIRFTDGTTEISMNQFGALAYYFLHEYKGKRGMVAKTVATSNMANSVAEKLGEKVFEPRVGFKEFKPVIGKALVMFEESDGISIIGHTPEKDAYIGLLLALDMTLSTGKNLGALKEELEEKFGAFYPDRDGVEVSLKGKELQDALKKLEKYSENSVLRIGGNKKKIKKVITIDGRKMILEDDSWLMIRPSGTEPKVRFYVESRNPEGTTLLVEVARDMLKEIGVLT